MNATTDGRPQTMVDVKLFKTIRLHQLLARPAGGGRYRTVLLAVVWLVLGLQLTRMARLHRVVGDPKLFAYVSMTMLYAVVSLYKGHALATHADGLRDVLEAADFGFTECGRRNPAGLLKCRAGLSAWLRRFAAVSYGKAKDGSREHLFKRRFEKNNFRE